MITNAASPIPINNNFGIFTQPKINPNCPSLIIISVLSLIILIIFLKNKIKKNIFTNPSLLLLIFSNLIAIYFAVSQGWQLSTVIFVYWFQSITIGFFSFIRILQLKEFSTEGVQINGQTPKPTSGTKIFTAFFFLIHYGGFHFGYLIFILIGNKIDFAEFKSILLIAFIFFLNHLFSYIYNKPQDTQKQNIGTIMSAPYARIVPMHLTIMLSSFFGTAVLPFFLILKTIADVMMHLSEHEIKKGEEQTS